ncbi:N-acetyltransferase [Thalassomonas viridans]|uniref:N-acetyltransferase n=1 Tax=Thalassomonas viridans TaxID=137584 RepID=A0AAE9Z984_9GAMM|nr:N-acetyltransferase [Thalassomonas viridans]WDE08572.1 N-acetyltransferase [Thalassomonas viridans]
MKEIKFISFNQVAPEDFLAIANENALRKHLIEHEKFTSVSIKKWINEKLEIESLEGCRIRAIYIDGALAGWCGIQPDDKGFELAIVISQKFWGSGLSIFKTLMNWAKELDHKEVLFHLLETRPEYKALNKIATKVHKTELLGRCFTTYYITVGKGTQKNF